VWVEGDDKAVMEKVRASCPKPALVVKTSPGHYHIYWKLNFKVTVAEQEAMNRALVLDVGADRAATDVSRVLRLPGFWHKGKDNTIDKYLYKINSVFVSKIPKNPFDIID
jgi:hypothetical protein